MPDPSGTGAGPGIDIAYALDARERVCSALTALRAESYRCLACGGRLAPQRSLARGACFRHLEARGCSGRGVARLAAGRILQGQLEEELREHGAVVWHRRCSGVEGVCRERAIFEQRVEVADWNGVRLGVEHAGLRLDVAVLAAGWVQVGFVLCERGQGGVVEGAGGDRGEAWLAALSLGEVLAFGPRVPRGEGG